MIEHSTVCIQVDWDVYPHTMAVSRTAHGRFPRALLERRKTVTVTSVMVSLRELPPNITPRFP